MKPETQRLILAMALVMGLTLVWQTFLRHQWERHPEWKRPEEAATQPTTAPTTGGVTTAPASLGSVGSVGTVATTGPTSGPATVATSNPVVAATKAVGAGIEVETRLGYDGYDPKGEHSPFPLGVLLNSRGASIRAVTLNHYRQEVSGSKPFAFQRPYKDQDAASAPLATTGLIVLNAADGKALAQLDNLQTVDWRKGLDTLAPDSQSMTFSLDVNDIEGRPLLTVSKTFAIQTAKAAAGKGEGYEVLVNYGFVNRGKQPLKVKVFFNGPTVLRPENNRDYPECVIGFDGGNSTVNLYHKSVSSVEEKPLELREARKEEAVLWCGVASSYFDAIVRGTDPQMRSVAFADVKAGALRPKEKDPADRDVVVAFQTAEVPVAADNAKNPDGFTLSFFAGPKHRAVLNAEYYARYPLNYDLTLVLTSGPCSVCTFPALINTLVWLLNKLHVVLRDWGLAIMALVVIVRALLHPITKRSQVSMSKMSKMGPQMQKLKEKYKDDKDALNKAMWELQKEQGLTPVLGCLPMFLQMPIWIALWSALQSTFEMRHSSFLWGFTWIKDLSQPDRLVAFGHSVPLLFFSIDAINLLPILLMVVFYVQQKMTPKPPATTPEQEQQQKMMQWMSLLFPVFLYSQPSGLNLYIFASTLIGIIESKRIRDHIKEQDEAEKAGVVLVDADPKDARPNVAGRVGKGGKSAAAEPEPKKGGLSGWFANLQQKAEDVRREAERRQSKKKP